MTVIVVLLFCCHFLAGKLFMASQKMHKNKNSLAVGIDSVYFFLELQILFVVQWMDQEKTSLPSGAQQKKATHLWSFISHWGERSRGVLSFKIGSRKIRFIERDESADSEKTSKFGALKTKNNTF